MTGTASGATCSRFKVHSEPFRGSDSLISYLCVSLFDKTAIHPQSANSKYYTSPYTVYVEVKTYIKGLSWILP